MNDIQNKEPTQDSKSDNILGKFEELACKLFDFLEK